MWGIGVDADQSYLGPHILTSALKRVDTARARHRQARPRPARSRPALDLVFNRKNGGEGIGKISSSAERKFVLQIKAV